MSSTADTDAATLLSFSTSGNAVVLGASGGLGGALSDSVDRSNRFAQVLRFSRASKPAIELTDEASIARAAQHVGRLGHTRLVIDATGFLHDGHQGPEKSWRDIDAASMSRTFAVNAIGPALIMKHFLPLFPPSGKALFATLSARVGSISENRLGGWYGYRAAKAALNQLMRTAAIELRRMRPDAICVALHPGTVDTPLSQPFLKSGLQVQSPTTAAHHLISLIDRLGSDDSGAFLDWKGAYLPW